MNSLKNRRGEVNLKTVGSVIMIAFAVIVGLALYQPSAAQVGASTTKVTVVNLTLKTSATNGGAVLLNGRDSVTNLVVRNSTSGTITSQYSARDALDTNGNPVVQLVTGASALTALSNGTWVNVSYVVNPDGYTGDGANSTVLTLVLVFAALAIAIVPFNGTSLVDLLKNR